MTELEAKLLEASRRSMGDTLQNFGKLCAYCRESKILDTAEVINKGHYLVSELGYTEEEARKLLLDFKCRVVEAPVSNWITIDHPHDPPYPTQVTEGEDEQGKFFVVKPLPAPLKMDDDPTPLSQAAGRSWWSEMMRKARARMAAIIEERMLLGCGKVTYGEPHHGYRQDLAILTDREYFMYMLGYSEEKAGKLVAFFHKQEPPKPPVVATGLEDGPEGDPSPIIVEIMSAITRSPLP